MLLFIVNVVVVFDCDVDIVDVNDVLVIIVVIVVVVVFDVVFDVVLMLFLMCFPMGMAMSVSVVVFCPHGFVSRLGNIMHDTYQHICFIHFTHDICG